MIPACPCLDDEIVLIAAVAVNRAIRHTETSGAHAGSFRQRELQIAFAEREGAEPGEVGLLATQPRILLGELDIRGSGYRNDLAGAATVVSVTDYGGGFGISGSDVIRANAIHVTTDREVSVHALNYLDANLGDDASGARGVAFTPQPDGTGLYCLAGADKDGGTIGALCKGYRPAPPTPDNLSGSIGSSCA